MKRLLLASTILAACGSTSAYAKCTVVSGSPLNLQFLSCSSDTQANDGDDIKMWVDNINDASSVFGSLGKNVNSDHNVTMSSLGGVFDSTTGNGFANFKSVMDDVEGYIATPDAPSTMPVAPFTFNGFDGELFRGQLVNNVNLTTKWDGDVSIVVNLSDGTQAIHTFKGFKTNKDIGVLGFDEVMDPGIFVKSALAFAGDVDASGKPIIKGSGSWDEFKQIEFSVPGAVAVIPEPSTWVMAITGFTMLGFVAFAKRRVALY